MAEIDDLNTTDASNTARFPEGQLPSSVNNGNRALEGMIARGLGDTILSTLATAGSGNTYTLTPNRTITSYTDGQHFRVEANHTNTGAATLNVSSLGAKAVVLTDGSTLHAGAMTLGGKYDLVYDGAQFFLLNPTSTDAQIKADYESNSDTNAYTDAEQTKVGYLTVTQAVDLDAIETRVNGLDAAVVLQGTWDASAGTFPGGGTAQAGDSWIVSVAGTVDSTAFALNDRIIAILDNASTSTYATNWHKADYSDEVVSVAGLTGAVAASGLRTALNVENGATADQTDAEIRAAVESALDSNVFTDADHTKLDGLTNVTNYALNPDMRLAEQGTTAISASGSYGPMDQWSTSVSGDTFSTTQEAFTSGHRLYDPTTAGDTATQHYAQIVVTSVANAANYCIFQQKFEDVRRLAGQTVTVSFDAEVASGTSSIGVELYQSFGAGGSPSATVTGTGQAVTLSTTSTRHSVTIDVPDINGKTIGTTEGTSATILNFWLDAGSNHNTRSGSCGQASKTVKITNVKVEINDAATSFEAPDLQTELAKCQRYYRKFSTKYLRGQVASQIHYVNFNFGLEMRVAPTISLNASYTNSSAGAAINITKDGCELHHSPTAINGFMGFTLEANARM